MQWIDFEIRDIYRGEKSFPKLFGYPKVGGNKDKSRNGVNASKAYNIGAFADGRSSVEISNDIGIDLLESIRIIQEMIAAGLLQWTEIKK